MADFADMASDISMSVFSNHFKIVHSLLLTVTMNVMNAVKTFQLNVEQLVV